MSDDHKRWQARVISALLLLLAVAVGARVAAWLLMPLLPTLAIAAAVALICAFIFHRRL